MSRELRAMADYRKALGAVQSIMPQATNAIEDFKKSFPARLEEIARGKERVDPWLCSRKSGLPTRRASAEEQDHPTLGQARNASLSAERPAHRLDLYLRRDLSEEGKAVGLILPKCNTEAMQLRSG